MPNNTPPTPLKTTALWAKRKARDDARLDNNMVRVDRPHAVTQGLWNALATTESNKLERWTASAPVGMLGDTITFSGTDRLGSTELTVFMGIAGISVGFRAETKRKGVPNAAVADHTTTQPTRLSLRGKLGLVIDGPSIPPASVAYFTKYYLTKLVTGSDGGANWARVDKALDKLMATKVRFENADGSFQYDSNLISGRVVVGDEVAVALNPLVSGAILGTGRQYIQMEFDQLTRLPEGSARIIYTFVSGNVFMGRVGTFNRDELVTHAFGPAEVSKQTLYGRRKTVEDVMLNHIGKLEGWAITLNTRGQYTVDRTKGVLK